MARFAIVLARLILTHDVLPGVRPKKIRLVVCVDACGWGNFMARIPAGGICPGCGSAGVRFARGEVISIRCLEPVEPPCQESTPELRYNSTLHTWRDFRCTEHQMSP
jgi:hypothetical protein